MKEAILRGLRDWMAIAIFLVFFLSLSSVSAVESVELAYDNSKMSATRAGSGAWGFAVSFSPPTADWPIQRVRIYGYRFGTGTENMQFKIDILATNYTQLYSAIYPTTIFGNLASWVDIDIEGPKVSERFFVVFYTGGTSDRGINMGIDFSVPNRHSEIISGSNVIKDWNQVFKIPLRQGEKEQSNWMIRVVGGGGTLKPASTQTTTTSQPSTPFLGFLDMSRLQQIGGVAATAGAGFLGWFLKTRKRRFVSGYLMKIDSTYNQYSMNREECKKRLAEMKEEAIQLLKKGKIDEPHFTLVDNKLTQYLKDLG